MNTVQKHTKEDRIFAPDDPAITRMVGGAPGRHGNSYENSPERQQWLRNIAANGNQMPEAQKALTAEDKLAGVAPANRHMEQQRQQTAARGGMYAGATAEAKQQLGDAFRGTRTAFQGAGQNIREAYDAGGLPAAAGATLRNTMVPAVGLLDDVTRPVRQYARPAAEGAATAGRAFLTGNPEPYRIPPGSSPANEKRKDEEPTSVNADVGPYSTADIRRDLAQGGNDFIQLSDRERDAAGDAYRGAWQRMTGGEGMRNAGDDAAPMYNAEQQVRGTGISARRQENGNMEFSGRDVAGSPSGSFTQGVDMQLGNDRYARANEERARMRGEHPDQVRARRESMDRDLERARASGDRQDVERAREQVRWNAFNQQPNRGAMAILSGLEGDRNAERDRVAAGTAQRQAAESEQLQQQMQMEADAGLRQAQVTGQQQQNRALAFANQQAESMSDLQQRAMQGDQEAMVALQMMRPAERPTNRYRVENLDTGEVDERGNARRVPLLLDQASGEYRPINLPQQTKPIPEGMTRESIMQAAERYLRAGADPDSVMARLREYGLSMGAQR